MMTDGSKAEAQRVFQGRLPNDCWFVRFQNRNNLSLPIPENISQARWSMERKYARDSLFDPYAKIMVENNLQALTNLVKICTNVLLKSSTESNRKMKCLRAIPLNISRLKSLEMY